MSSVLENLAETSKNGKAGPRPYADETLFEQCPDLAEWLSCEQFRGQPRRTPTLTLFVEDGRLKCVLNDRATDQTSFWTFSSAFGVWTELQDALCHENLEWRPSRKGYGKR